MGWWQALMLVKELRQWGNESATSEHIPKYFFPSCTTDISKNHPFFKNKSFPWLLANLLVHLQRFTVMWFSCTLSKEISDLWNERFWTAFKFPILRIRNTPQKKIKYLSQLLGADFFSAISWFKLNVSFGIKQNVSCILKDSITHK